MNEQVCAVGSLCSWVEASIKYLLFIQPKQRLSIIELSDRMCCSISHVLAPPSLDRASETIHHEITSSLQGLDVCGLAATLLCDSTDLG